MNFFLNNREFIKNLKINTGTSGSPVYTEMCTTSEITLNSEFEMQDFYVFCDAIQRSLITGVALGLNTTVKIDMNNTAFTNILGKISACLENGTVAQFNNETIQFDLLTGINEGVLEYTTYTAPVVMNISDLGGAAEDVAEFTLEMTINGKATK